MYTYFIQAGRGDGPIKIGKAFKPRKRLRTLQCGNPCVLTLVAVVEGDCEQLLHDLFGQHRIRGEWFEFDIIDNIRKLAKHPLLTVGVPLDEIVAQFDRNSKECDSIGMHRYEYVGMRYRA